MEEKQKNVLGFELATCGTEPITGFFRDGCCNTSGSDVGTHTVCAIVNNEFLEFSKRKGNDLTTPRPEFNFSGLKEGDSWCLCALRWKEAYDAGCAPRVKLTATNIKTLKFIKLDVLKSYQADLN